MGQSQQAGKPQPLRFDGTAVPQELKRDARWLVWGFVERDEDKWAKEPFMSADSRRHAKANDPKTWGTYDAAIKALLDNRELAGPGFVLGDGLVGVDVDDCIDELGNLSELGQQVLDEVPGYAEMSPSGRGLKIITRATIPGSKADHKRGLELYDHSRYFAVTGAAWPGRDNTIPARSIDLRGFYLKHFGSYSPASNDGEYDALANAKTPLAGYDVDRVIAEILPHLDPAEYGPWLEVGQALHHQGEAGDEWLEAWDAWSAPAEKYAVEACAEKWETFGDKYDGRGSVTLATLIHYVKQKRAAEKFDRSDHWSMQIEGTADRVQLLEEIPRLIARDLAVDPKVREILAQQLKRRIRTALNTPFSISVVRTWLAPAVEDNTHHACPDWLKRYVYVRDEDRFMNLENRQRYSRNAFNMTHNRDMPKNENGDPIKPASEAASDLYGIRVVDAALYHPALGQFFPYDGRSCVNAYDASQIPEVPPVLLDDEDRAVATVQQHLTNLLPDERERQLFTNWLAFVVQNPGLKVRWAPYLCGVPGDGKSFFGVLLQACMGKGNVKVMNGDQLKGNFSDWGSGRCVTLIEEAKLHGADKFDAVNRIKPFITNDDISIHPKGRAEYNAPNTVQYMVASNYLDGMPVTDDDRRMMFLQTGFSIGSLKAFKLADPRFYKRLFDAVENYPGAMRAWLYHYNDWHPDFEPDHNAPMTAMRDLVIELSESDADSACKIVFDSAPGGVTASWVAVVPFASAVEAYLGPHAGYRRSQIARICADFLRARGYRKMGSDRPRFGPDRAQSALWKHESVEADPLTWLETAKQVIAKSFADAAGRDFLD